MCFIITLGPIVTIIMDIMDNRYVRLIWLCIVSAILVAIDVLECLFYFSSSNSLVNDDERED